MIEIDVEIILFRGGSWITRRPLPSGKDQSIVSRLNLGHVCTPIESVSDSYSIGPSLILSSSDVEYENDRA